MVRRWMVLATVAALALAAFSPTTDRADSHAGAAQGQTGGIEPRAGTWRTWVLSSGNQIRPAPPPGAAETQSELQELRALAAGRDAAARGRIAFWDAGAPGYRWNEIMLAALGRTPTVNTSRAQALMNVAIYDATIAAWDAKYTFNRPRPSAADAALDTAVATPNSPSYPSEHAVAAGAAAAVLAFLIPNEADSFAAMAEEAGRSRVLAGVNYPSDVAAGLEIGRRVGALVVEHARIDGTTTPVTGALPTGPNLWSLRGYPATATAVDRNASSWRTWVIASPSALRSEVPPSPDSAQMAAELAEVKNFNRTFATNQAAFFWAPFAFPRWIAIANQKIFEERLDTNPPRAARVFALASIAGFDAIAACFENKYTYMQPRPFQLDSSITTLFQTPAHPSYPAAHGCQDGAWEAVLAYLFPRDAAFFAGRAEEAANSRVWAGIHFRSDIAAGLALGRAAGRAVIERARLDGAD